MLKNILNLEGAQQLSKNEQSTINGGKDPKYCLTHPNGSQCGGTTDYVCRDGVCTYCPGC